uniref:EF-hand domain-containing protein n=1 Tax=Plectus sambesii TaxID=2011161 RepID=A0A914WRH5_9BILA
MTNTSSHSFPLELRFELENSDEHFARSDKNNDDKLDLQEFQQRGNICFEATAPEFEISDSNGDGFISRPEYMTFFQQKILVCRRMNHDNSLEKIKSFDQDGDRKLQIAEVEEMLERMYKMQVRPNFRRIFERFDAEKDGGLDEIELESLEDSIPFRENDRSQQKSKRQRRQ